MLCFVLFSVYHRFLFFIYCVLPSIRRVPTPRCPSRRLLTWQGHGRFEAGRGGGEEEVARAEACSPYLPRGVVRTRRIARTPHGQS